MPRLEKWKSWQVNYFSPDVCLIGYVFNDDRFHDGSMITTSRVIELDLDKGCAITKSGTRYELGERLVSDHYESEWFDG